MRVGWRISYLLLKKQRSESSHLPEMGKGARNISEPTASPVDFQK